MPTTKSAAYAAYTRASRRWYADLDLDRAFGTNYAAESVVKMRAAYAAYKAL